MAKASLYKTSQNIRKGALAIIVAIGVIVAGDLLIKASEEVLNPIPVGGSFYQQQDKLDEVEIPSLPLSTLPIENGSNPEFVVEGVFPFMPDTAYAYSIEPPTVRLDYEANAVRTAGALGFVPGTNYTSLNGSKRTDLIWENTSETRTLKHNADELTWVMQTKYFFDTAALQPKVLLASEAAYGPVAKRIISSIGLGSGAGLSEGTVRSTFATLGSDALFTNPVNPNNANYVSVDIFRKLPMARLRPRSEWPPLAPEQEAPPEFDGLVYKSNPDRGSLHMIIGDGGENPARDVYELSFTNFNYRSSVFVRDILTPQEAWTAVRTGDGKLRQLKPQTADFFADSGTYGVKRFTLIANQTELALYEPDQWDGFVYPIYVFRGRADLTNGLTADFVFYMEAIERGVIQFE